MNDTTFQGDGKVAYVPVVVNTKMTKPQINADRIRAMTDEELADWLGKETIFCCDRGRDCRDEPCEPCLLRWLKSPVEVDNA